MKPSRRDVLHALLGGPLALAACKSKTRRPPLPEGELVSRAETLGHKLRDASIVEPAKDRWETASVVIVGAGVAGLSAAWRLARSGFDDFVVLELDTTAGGTSQSGQSSVSAYPWGAHYITAPMADNRAFVTLLAEMGIFEGTDDDGQPLVAEQYLCRDPSERLFYRGRWYKGLYLEAGASRQDLAQKAEFDAAVGRLANLRDGRGRRAFAVPLAASSDDPELTALDRMSMANWLDAHGFDSPRLRWWVEYACRDDYGATAADTSAWAGLFYFASRLLSSDAEYRPVVTWPEGNGRLIRHLLSGLDQRIRVGWGVAQVQPVDRDGRSGVRVVALTDAGASAAGIDADQVIFAAPQFVASHTILPYRDDPPAHISEFDYSPWLVANLTLRDRTQDLGFPLSWDNVLYDSPSLGYVVATHQRGADRGPTVLTYYYPFVDSDSRKSRRTLLEAGWSDWADVVLTDLERAHRDIRTLTQRLDVMRWGHAMIRPKIGFISGTARRDAARPYRGIHFAHSDLSGVALFEEAFYHGVRAAEEVLAARSIAHQSLL